jgi:hypothetical protein
MNISLNHALLVVSLWLAAVASRRWIHASSVFEFWMSLQNEEQPQLLIYTFLFILCASVLRLILIWGGGPLTARESRQVRRKLTLVAPLILFEFATARLNRFSSVIIFAGALLEHYVAAYSRQKRRSICLTATLPTVTGHQKLLFTQLVALISIFCWNILLIASLEMNEWINILHQSISAGCSLTADILSHISFLHDSRSDHEVFLITAMSDIYASFSSLINIAFVMSINRSFYLREMYDYAIELTSGGRRIEKWLRTAVVIDDFPQAGKKDLAREQLCVICLEPIQLGDSRRPPCGHCLHWTCLMNWCLAHSICPLCRLSWVRPAANDKHRVRNNRRVPDVEVLKFDDIMAGEAQ